ncbi:MAG: hypothetical protein Q4C58_10330 [Eubacteriales bacterium]|nr:hypothetical protein [Eubacteriales bacterium]
MRFTDEIIEKLDDNNLKAKEIISGALNIIGEEEVIINGVDIVTLIDVAFDYLKANNGIFGKYK